MLIHKLISQDRVFLDIKSRTRDEIIAELADIASKANTCINKSVLWDKLLEREKLGSTALGRGLAIPHCKLEKFKKPLVIMAVSKQGIKEWSIDGKPVHIIFLVVSPLENPNTNLNILSSIAQLARKSNKLASKLVRAKSANEAAEIIRLEEAGYEE